MTRDEFSIRSLLNCASSRWTSSRLFYKKNRKGEHENGTKIKFMWDQLNIKSYYVTNFSPKLALLWQKVFDDGARMLHLLIARSILSAKVADHKSYHGLDNTNKPTKQPGLKCSDGNEFYWQMHAPEFGTTQAFFTSIVPPTQLALSELQYKWIQTSDRVHNVHETNSKIRLVPV